MVNQSDRERELEVREERVQLREQIVESERKEAALLLRYAKEQMLAVEEWAQERYVKLERWNLNLHHIERLMGIEGIARGEYALLCSHPDGTGSIKYRGHVLDLTERQADWCERLRVKGGEDQRRIQLHELVLGSEGVRDMGERVYRGNPGIPGLGRRLVELGLLDVRSGPGGGVRWTVPVFRVRRSEDP